MNTQFSGSALECLAHYADKFWPPKGSKDAAKAKMPLAEFVGVNAHTVTSWLSGQNKPIGLPLIKLCAFLEANSYDVGETRGLQRPNRMAADLIAFNAFTPEELSKELEFGGDKNSVLRIARGGSNTSSKRAAKLNQIYSVFQGDIAEARAKIQPTAVPITAKQMKSPVDSNGTQAVVVVDEERIAVQSLAYLVLAITPLLEGMVANTTKEERSMLRRLVGNDGMFRLSIASSQLCSEKAREIHHPQQ